MQQLRSRDLNIKKYINRDGAEIEIVQLDWSLATDPDFIQECRDFGVKNYVKKEKPQEGGENGEEE